MIPRVLHADNLRRYAIIDLKETTVNDILGLSLAVIVLLSGLITAPTKKAYPLKPETAGEFGVHIRIHGWLQNRPVPGNLYQYLDKNDDKIIFRVNGSIIPLNLRKSFARIRRNWKR